MLRILTAFGLLLGICGFMLFVALAVGSWVAKREADRQVAATAAQARQAGDVVERVIVLIREVIARAKAALVAARADPTAVPGAEADPLVRMAMWKAKRDLPGEVAKARDAVGIASEAVVVFGAALDVFGEHRTDESALGVKPREMEAVRSKLDSAASDLKNARSVLGITIPGATAEDYSKADAALAQAIDVTERFDGELTAARQKVDDIQRKAETWSLRAAIAVAALAVLAAVGQVFMVRSCWRSLRAAAAPTPG